MPAKAAKVAKPVPNISNFSRFSGGLCCGRCACERISGAEISSSPDADNLKATAGRQGSPPTRRASGNGEKSFDTPLDCSFVPRRRQVRAHAPTGPPDKTDKNLECFQPNERTEIWE
jgi:hypothetical protein